MPKIQLSVRRMMAFVAVLALPMALMSLINQGREAARESSCKGQLFQYGFALHNYVEANGHLPSAFVTDNAGTPTHSWRLSFLSSAWAEHPVNALCDLTVPWDHPNNAASRAYDSLGGFFFWCPSGDGRRTKSTSYVAVVGPETAWPDRTGRKLSEITDDPASTILVLEIAHSGIHWMEPKDLALDDLLAAGLSSNHALHINALFADFQVRRVRKNLPRETLRSLLTINGGEQIDPKNWEYSKH
ncbi:DUF1559 domain-containing protein [Singulisphaera sp. Ch08]|uniref:DUF1559 domain-containing protein n=1 Tax=Singulisphaera sp. Ch08 TaxID=3120278 RepID=A0AAU7CBA8_9BACT